MVESTLTILGKLNFFRDDSLKPFCTLLAGTKSSIVCDLFKEAIGNDVLKISLASLLNESININNYIAYLCLGTGLGDDRPAGQLCPTRYCFPRRCPV